MAFKTDRSGQRTGLINWKTRLNQIAELGWQENRTTHYIKQQLKDAPLIDGFNPGHTGLLYKLGKGNRAILLRADIDALRTRSGVAHICGHSSHTAALMSAYLFAQKQSDRLRTANKSIYFLFQPCEEGFPSGARAFLDQARSHLHEIKYAFATHVRPLMPPGQIGLVTGPVFARGDYFEIAVRGTQVHVKNAPEGIDAIETASHLVLEIKKIQKRYLNRLRINVGVINGGRQANTVADLADLKGDIRLCRDADQTMIKNRLKTIISALEKRYRATIDLRYFSGYPVLTNERALVKKIVASVNFSGKKIVTRPDLFSFGCEDFSFISARFPSLFALVGTGDRHDLHEDDCVISDRGTETARLFFQQIISWWLTK
ncbi:M20 family metallopeptidase [Patescibacteria group bacterium]|nr:M20 family metallopeptidase [Patescibacteria group bacterium]MCL5091781.1 M20 family metallopeptidase [Patescibacteria group bacterium]